VPPRALQSGDGRPGTNLQVCVCETVARSWMLPAGTTAEVQRLPHRSTNTKVTGPGHPVAGRSPRCLSPSPSHNAVGHDHGKRWLVHDSRREQAPMRPSADTAGCNYVNSPVRKMGFWTVTRGISPRNLERITAGSMNRPVRSRGDRFDGPIVASGDAAGHPRGVRSTVGEGNQLRPGTNV